MDCLPFVEMLGPLGSHTRNAALVNLFSPVLDGKGKVTLVWVPGDMGIGGNVVTNQAAKDGCGIVVDELARGGMLLNVRNDAVAKELRAA